MLGDKYQEYAKINANKLFEGMFISADIYYKNRDNFVLVFKSSLLTRPLIQKINQLKETYGDLYVKKEHYKRIMDQFHQYDEILKRLEFETNYRAIKDRTAYIFDTIIKENTILHESAEIVSKIILENLINADNSVIIQLINYVRDEDDYLCTHSINVAFLNGLIAKWLDMSQSEMLTLISAGLLHDVGRTKISPAILNKPSNLTKEEYDIVKRHPIHSYDLLLSSGEINRDVLFAARNHHEKINGSGYPDGLRFDAIPRSARITAISDTYDAMVTRRAYRNQYSPFDILTEFSERSKSDLDRDIVKLFLTKMPFELVGQSVLLSNGSIAKVVYIDPDQLSFPLVQIGSQVFQTDESTYCICMCGSAFL